MNEYCEDCCKVATKFPVLTAIRNGKPDRVKFRLCEEHYKEFNEIVDRIAKKQNVPVITIGEVKN